MADTAHFEKHMLSLSVASLALIRSYDPEGALEIARASGRAHDELARKLKENDHAGFQRSDDPRRTDGR